MVNQTGYSLVEIIIAIALSAIVGTLSTIAVLNLKEKIESDIVYRNIEESINLAQIKAHSGKVNDSGNQDSYGVAFFDNRIVSFRGSTYVEDEDSNIEYNLPAGFTLSVLCDDLDSSVIFEPIDGQSSDSCEVEVYHMDDLQYTIKIGLYGIE